MLAVAMGHIGASHALIILGADPSSVVIKGSEGTHSVSSLAEYSGITIPGL
jgi:hypothetical protein